MAEAAPTRNPGHRREESLPDVVFLGAGAFGLPTLGMLAANIPALLLGSKLLQAVPLNRVRIAAGLCFIAFGLWGMIVA